MEVNYIALAIPFFFALIALELVIARLQGRSYYRFNDAIAALGCGIGQQVTGIFMKATLAGGYIYFYERFALFALEASPVLAWAVAFVGVDVLYYWWHRASHRINLIWATHAVHHQSQEYNLAVALRQAWFSDASLWFFYLPLALLGVPPLVFLAMKSFSVLYQFWIHTRTIDKLGPLELVLNTPSHHRVHHAINPAYIDKNYGAILIVWDRLFGTFEEEREECVYGTVKPFTSWNSIWANFEYLAALAADAWHAPRFADKFKVWVAHPGWRPTGLGEYAAPGPVDARTFRKWDTQSSRAVNVYVALNFLVTTAVTTWLLHREPALAMSEKAFAASVILATLLSWGALLEAKKWAIYLEAARLPIAAALLFLIYLRG